ncbi:MAG: diacylglycerol kinase family protein [Chloroflexi bacterium]|nr:diacylglycerol kinase family protein [Chloroflexota bacterium]
MTSYLLIANPASGSGRGCHRADLLANSLPDSCQVEVVETKCRGSAAEIAADRGSDVDRVIAVGGDGTLNEILSGLMARGLPSKARPALGFLPSGTGNAATRAFGFSSDPILVARSLPTAPVRPVDVGVVTHAGGERPFLLWLGAGFDAVLIAALHASRTGRMGVTGLLRKLPEVLGALARYQAPDIEVEVDGTEFGVACSMILPNVAKIPFGGTVAETADPFDGLLDIVAIPRGSKLRLTQLGLSLLVSSLHRARGVRHSLGTRIGLRSEGDVPFQLDGEPVGKLPVDVRLERGAVRLLLT